MKRSLPCIMVLLGLFVLQGVQPARAEDYSGEFQGGWSFAQVNGSVATLDTSPDSPCEVKAYGWKLLSRRHVKSKRDPWYSLGDTWNKWGWKIVVKNTRREPVDIALAVGLYTQEKFLLDSQSRPLLPFSPPEIIQPGETRTLTGVSEYNATAHKGEGSPALFGWAVRPAKRH